MHEIDDCPEYGKAQVLWLFESSLSSLAWPSDGSKESASEEASKIRPLCNKQQQLCWNTSEPTGIRCASYVFLRALRKR
ncbi:hypothetical protein E4U57_004861 [Claviceps arundinis]|uniref:Uncharacterized protein n=1 Tax=Claviceps arundinis TaxID=1623583 RepID=A0A9P7MQ40_9HYPO|nr:hypothetical protein E4U56_003196 [Claviceps arundinis]KAG5964836.1 hypothetical protein E4U57_004861 [Claviceps arundinis]